MAIDSVTIGPFKGGLNNVSQAGEAADTELVELLNMDVTTDGAVTSRPPMARLAGVSSNVGQSDFLGIYRQSPDSWYIVVQTASAAQWVVRAYFKGDYSQATTIKASTNVNSKVSAYVQVGDMGYFCSDPTSGSTLNGFKWSPTTTATDIPAMPKGTCMVSFKSRLWITGSYVAVNNSRMWFSTIDSAGIKLESWNTAVDYFDVAPGEGGYNTALIALNSSLIVLKNDGTWRFSYSSSPGKGIVDRISGTVGAANKNCVVEFNNLVYTYDQGKLYELVNNNYSAINRKVEFREDTNSAFTAIGTDLSVVGTKLILRYFNALYVYNGETGTWSQWRSSVGIPGKFFEMPADSNYSVQSTYRASSVHNANKSGAAIQWYFIELDGEYSVTAKEEIECVIRTKSYDYKAPSVYKRLFWWGMDHKSFSTFTAMALPVTKRRIPTWGEMKAYTWGEAAQGTWGSPLKWLSLSTFVSDGSDVSNEQTDNGRIFSKMQKSLMFRQIAFEIRMRTNGSKSQGPVKIFSLITLVSPKHNVVDKNN